MPLSFVAHGKTDRGILRSKNEDFLLLDPAHGVYAVADGVGGLPHGEAASREAIESLQRSLLRPTDELGWHDLKSAFQRANRDVLDLSERLQSPLNVGTTLTALQVKGDTVRFAHVGDSALFRFQDGWCDKLTRDHTVAEEHHRWLDSLPTLRDEERAHPLHRRSRSG
jgi:PPM family protein phosphatase